MRYFYRGIVVVFIAAVMAGWALEIRFAQVCGTGLLVAGTAYALGVGRGDRPRPVDEADRAERLELSALIRAPRSRGERVYREAELRRMKELEYSIHLRAFCETPRDDPRFAVDREYQLREAQEAGQWLLQDRMKREPPRPPQEGMF